MRYLIPLCLALLLVSPALAAVPVEGPTKCAYQWNAPTTNTDGSALTDLKGYNVYVGTAVGVFPATPTVFVAAPSASPKPTDPVVVWDCRTQTWTDGAKWLTVRAVDLAGNESANITPSVADASNGATQAGGDPFVFDALKPSGATGGTWSP